MDFDRIFIPFSTIHSPLKEKMNDRIWPRICAQSILTHLAFISKIDDNNRGRQVLVLASASALTYLLGRLWLEESGSPCPGLINWSLKHEIRFLWPHFMVTIFFLFVFPLQISANSMCFTWLVLLEEKGINFASSSRFWTVRILSSCVCLWRKWWFPSLHFGVIDCSNGVSANTKLEFSRALGIYSITRARHHCKGSISFLPGFTTKLSWSMNLVVCVRILRATMFVAVACVSVSRRRKLL